MGVQNIEILIISLGGIQKTRVRFGQVEKMYEQWTHWLMGLMHLNVNVS
jgi:hypothetical protein